MNKICCRKFWCVSGSYISRLIRINFEFAPSARNVVKVPAQTIALLIIASTACNYYKYHRCGVTSLPSCDLELAYSYQRSNSDAGRLAPKL